MAETQSFREKHLEKCRNGLTSRTEAISLITLFQAKIDNLPIEMRGRQENPRQVITIFLGRLIQAFEQVPAEHLKLIVEQCILAFKKTHSSMSSNISQAANILKIEDLARDVWFLETIETQRTMDIAVTSLLMSITGTVKALVQTNLAELA